MKYLNFGTIRKPYTGSGKKVSMPLKDGLPFVIFKAAMPQNGDRYGQRITLNAAKCFSRQNTHLTPVEYLGSQTALLIGKISKQQLAE